MRWVVIGAGATGGYFGGQLVRAGKDVTFVARGDHFAALEARGLDIYSSGGRITFPVTVVDHPAHAGRADVVLLAVKCYDLETAIAQYRADRRARYPRPCVSRTVSMHRSWPRGAMDPSAPSVVGAYRGGAARARHRRAFFAVREVRVRCVAGANGPREQQIFQQLVDAGIDCELSADVHRALWEKMLTLCPLAASTSVTRSNVGRES
jgi:2-dehydropantoate 2-reductase